MKKTRVTSKILAMVCIISMLTSIFNFLPVSAETGETLAKIQSASVENEHPNQVVLVFDKPVKIPADISAGGYYHIYVMILHSDGVLDRATTLSHTGDGTTTLVLTIDRDIVYSDILVLGVNGYWNAIEDATQSKSIGNVDNYTIENNIKLTMNVNSVKVSSFNASQTPGLATIEVGMLDIGLNADAFSISNDTTPDSDATVTNAEYLDGKYILSVSGMTFYDSYTLTIAKEGYNTYTNDKFYGTLASDADLDLEHEPNMFLTFSRELTSAGIVTISNDTYAANQKLYEGAVYDAIDGNNGHPDNGTVTRLIGIFAKAPEGTKGVKVLKLNGQMQQVTEDSLIDSNPNYQETVASGKEANDNDYWKTIAFVPLYSQIASERQSDGARKLVDPDDRFRIIEWYDNETCTGSAIKVIRLMVKTEYTGTLKDSDAGLTNILGQDVTMGNEAGTLVDPKTVSINVDNTKATLGLLDIEAVDNTTIKLYSNAAFSQEIIGDSTIPLTAGGAITVYIKVTAQDGSNIKYYAVTIHRAAAPSNENTDDNTPYTPVQPTNTGVETLVNGKMETVATATTTKINDKSVTTVVVDDKKIETKLQQEGNNAVVTLFVKNNSDVVVGTLNAQTVKNMEAKDATLEIKTENISYVLPAKQINIDKISEQMGAAVALKDIAVNIKISAAQSDTVKIVENTANKNNYQLVVKPVDFEITCTRAGKTLLVEKFNGYVERVIAIPAGVDPNKITTGIVMNADGSFSHVPTEVFEKNGKWYAKLNSLTNSTYSIIWNPVTVASVENHWSKVAVNDMASRLVIKNPISFTPDSYITRGEFAEYITKALGIYRTEVAKAGKFSDVDKNSELADAITVASDYGIISGYTDGSFRPDAKITREEAMTMYAKAMDIVKLGEVNNNRIEKYSDKDEVSGWAYDYVKKTISAGVFNGKTADTIAPKGTFTYAEAAEAIRNLLVAAKLINK